MKQHRFRRYIYDEEMVKANLSPETLANIPLVSSISNISLIKKYCGIEKQIISTSKRVVSDFEIGLLLTVAAEFPQVIHQGCYFHYNQCINRRIQSLGLSTTYAEDDEIRSCCRKLMALCLLPLQEVENQFYNLRASSDSRLKQKLCQLFLYSLDCREGHMK
ncbi:unnamed protein product [Adineta ricciae]|uniref:MULE transposase domain-containing protein n=1 Tax=Adineta ricciae TaxID=249248 RepID=A0A815K0L9_ADIRI|nr:unnamed protein product [Adineta ricciae]